MKCLIIGTPGDVRVKGFQDALSAYGHPPAEVISYPSWLGMETDARRSRLKAADRVRVESPGREAGTVRAICNLSRLLANDLVNEGRDDSPQQSARLGLGLIAAIVATNLHATHGMQTRFLNNPAGICLTCDKVQTSIRLGKRDIQVPGLLDVMDGQGSGYERVMEAMNNAGISRAFIKLRHGFSGSGVVAYQFSKTSTSRELAITTVAMRQTDAGTRLYNTRKLQRYTEHDQVRALFDALCPLGVYIEPWIPKAGVNNRTTDLRVVTIAGEARHIVLRMSRNPITNLHLLNERSGPGPLKDAMRPADWDALIETCERVARCFPSMLYLGIDVAVHADLRGHTVLEVNAFGDLLHGVTDRGQTTYEAEVEAMTHWSGSLD